MARAELAPGTWRDTVVIGQAEVEGRWIKAPTGTRATRYRATTVYRDRAGKRHSLDRYADTAGKARSKLNAALAEWEQAQLDAVVVPDEMTLAEAAALWLSQVERDPRLSAKSKRLYRGQHDRYVAGTELAALPLSQANTVPALRAFMQALADERGTATAQTVRSVVSGVLNLAVEDGRLPLNAMRVARPVAADPKVRAKVKADRDSEREKAGKAVRLVPRDTRRALTRDERAHLMATADVHEQAVSADVADIVAFMAATGVRIGEALGQRWADVELGDNERAGKTMIRGTKSASAVRVVTLPQWMVERLRGRAAAKGTHGLVFASPHGTDPERQRDDRNVQRVFRDVLDAAGFPWATSHVLRRTVATLLDDAGMPITLAQAQLGHANAAMTASVYLGRRTDLSAAAAVL